MYPIRRVSEQQVELAQPRHNFPAITVIQRYIVVLVVWIHGSKNPLPISIKLLVSSGHLNSSQKCGNVTYHLAFFPQKPGNSINRSSIHVNPCTAQYPSSKNAHVGQRNGVDDSSCCCSGIPSFLYFYLNFLAIPKSKVWIDARLRFICLAVVSIQDVGADVMQGGCWFFLVTTGIDWQVWPDDTF